GGRIDGQSRRPLTRHLRRELYRFSSTEAPMTAQSSRYRVEHDLLGDRNVPIAAYYGVHTLRATENFPITGAPISIYPDLISGLACVKQAAARANQGLRLLDKKRADAIVKACQEIRGGELLDQFVVDVIQGGAGTSTNM